MDFPLSLMTLRKTVAVYSQNCTTPLNTFCCKFRELFFFYITPINMHNFNWASNGWFCSFQAHVLEFLSAICSQISVSTYKL